MGAQGGKLSVLVSHLVWHNKPTIELPSKFFCHMYIKTHDSESRGQEEVAVCDERVNYLHVALL